MALVKICGLSTAETVRAALDGGAAFIGFVFIDKSPRNIALQAAQRLAEPARGGAKVVAVTVDPSDELVERLARTLRPDFIQLHRSDAHRLARELGARVR